MLFDVRMIDRVTRMMNMTRKFLCFCVVISTMLCPSWVLAESSDGTQVRIAELLSNMTIEQKVGQMTQVNLGAVIDKTVKDRVQFDPELFNAAMHQYQVGSILNSTSRALSVEEWHEVLTTIQDEALKNDLSIPVLYGIDAIHGVTYTKGSTLFPHNIGMGASRNPELVKQAAKVTAMEARASGLRWNFDPVLDTGRNPIWPRFPETFGEDSYLVTSMGVAAINGYRKTV